MAKGKVTAVVLSKHDFADLDNPLLSWMLDYDAVANVLKVGTMLGSKHVSRCQ